MEKNIIKAVRLLSAEKEVSQSSPRLYRAGKKQANKSLREGNDDE